MNETPGVDMSTGSLGQGISAACGMALGAKHAGSAVNVYAILGLSLIHILPASILQMHPDFILVADEEALSLI